MNYSKLYDKLIAYRKEKPPECGEWHHVVPRCLGGSDDSDNLVLLTWREHFIAHRLLCRMYPENHKLKYAVYMMTLIQQDKNRNPNSRDVAVARQYLSQAAKERGFNPGRSINSREKARERMLSSDNPIKKNPEKNHTAHPVVVTYTDGSNEYFECAAFIPIPYGTVKHIRRYNTGSRKHGILSIKRFEG